MALTTEALLLLGGACGLSLGVVLTCIFYEAKRTIWERRGIKAMRAGAKKESEALQGLAAWVELYIAKLPPKPAPGASVADWERYISSLPPHPQQDTGQVVPGRQPQAPPMPPPRG